MANYAFRPRQLSNYVPRQRVNNFSQMQHQMFDEEPAAAFLQWLDWLRPSTAARGNLQRQQQDLYNRYVARDINGPMLSGDDFRRSFMDYLTQINPQREVLSQSPYARGNETRRFRNPATRWNSFS